jgi:hypothetical protein
MDAGTSERPSKTGALLALVALGVALVLEWLGRKDRRAAGVADSSAADR